MRRATGGEHGKQSREDSLNSLEKVKSSLTNASPCPRSQVVQAAPSHLLAGGCQRLFTEFPAALVLPPHPSTVSAGQLEWPYLNINEVTARNPPKEVHIALKIPTHISLPCADSGPISVVFFLLFALTKLMPPLRDSDSVYREWPAPAPLNTCLLLIYISDNCLRLLLCITDGAYSGETDSGSFWSEPECHLLEKPSLATVHEAAASAVSALCVSFTVFLTSCNYWVHLFVCFLLLLSSLVESELYKERDYVLVFVLSI